MCQKLNPIKLKFEDQVAIHASMKFDRPIQNDTPYRIKGQNLNRKYNSNIVVLCLLRYKHFRLRKANGCHIETALPVLILSLLSSGAYDFAFHPNRTVDQSYGVISIFKMATTARASFAGVGKGQFGGTWGKHRVGH